MKVLCIGESSIEITCPINAVLEEGKHFKLNEKIECGSGKAGNVAYLFGKWGVETYIASMLGADDAANKIKKEYEAIGVKTDYIETSYDKSTSQTISIINSANKVNTLLEMSNQAILKKYAFADEPNLIVTDGLDLTATLTSFDKFKDALKVLMACESTKETMELCRYVNYVIFNKKTSEDFSGIRIDFNDTGTIVNAYNKLKQKFPTGEIIITLGEKGSVYSINNQVKIMPPVKVEVVDSNGAGSVYVGAFSYGMVRNFGLEKSIAYATIAASLSVTKMTSRNSIPALTEVTGYYDSKFGAENNPINQQQTQAPTPTQTQATPQDASVNNNGNQQNA